MRIQCRTGARAWEGIRKEYTGLYEACSVKNVFMCYGYLDTWLGRPGKNEGEEPYILMGYVGDRLVGIAPLMAASEKHLGIRIRTLYSMGSVLGDILDWLVLPSYAEDFYHSVLGFIREKTAFREVRLSSVTPECAIHPYASESSGMEGWHVQEFVDASCYYVDAGAESRLIDRVPEKTVKDMKYYLRRLEKEGNVRYFRVQNPAGLEVWLPQFFTLHVKRWSRTDTPSRFLCEDEKRYFSELAQKMLAEGFLEFNILLLDERPIAMHLGFSDSRRLYHYLPAFDPDQRSRSPGNLLIYLMFLDAGERKLSLFDFLRGDEKYKSSWTEAAVSCRSIILTDRRVRIPFKLIRRMDFILRNPGLVLPGLKRKLKKNKFVLKAWAMLQKVPEVIRLCRTRLVFYRTTGKDSPVDLPGTASLVSVDSYKAYKELFSSKGHEILPGRDLERFSRGSVFHAVCTGGKVACCGWSVKCNSFYVSELQKTMDLPHYTVLYDFFTYPEYRRQGYYSLLLKLLQRTDPKEPLLIYAKRENTASNGAIQKAGFELVGVVAWRTWEPFLHGLDRK